VTVRLPTNDDPEVRRRRLLWRASHRGTKELDLIIGGYASAKVVDMDEGEFLRFERFLDSEEPDLQDWILGGTAPADAPNLDLIRAIRRFHGLE
jgi:antitoxin CptB